MSTQIAEASVVLVADRSQFDAEIASLKSELAAISGGGGGGFARSTGGGSRLSNLGQGSGAAPRMNPIAGSRPLGGVGQIAQRRSAPSSSGSSLMRNAIADVRGGAKKTGENIGMGIAEGIKSSSASINQEARGAVAGAFGAAKQEAEIASPSGRAAREVGRPIADGMAVGARSGAPGVASAVGDAFGDGLSVGGGSLGGLGGGLGFPIMAQVEMATHFGTAAMMANMWDAARFTFWSAGMNLLGGVTGALGIPGFGGMAGLNVINDPNGQSVFGLGLRNIFDNQFNPGQTQNAGILIPGLLSPIDRMGIMSRSIIGQLPNDIKDFLQGGLESFLPDWASDMLGTLIGTKPILQKEAVFADGKFARTGTGFGDEKAFTDSP
ncbi:MAG: hypothetical protein ACPGWR_13660, partial [Ardenticatenaceae bacterium]